MNIIKNIIRSNNMRNDARNPMKDIIDELQKWNLIKFT